MEHAIPPHEIHVKLEEDPIYYQSLRERLEPDHHRPGRRAGSAKPSSFSAAPGPRLATPPAVTPGPPTMRG